MNTATQKPTKQFGADFSRALRAREKFRLLNEATVNALRKASQERTTQEKTPSPKHSVPVSR
jgi:hypothetical protein